MADALSVQIKLLAVLQAITDRPALLQTATGYTQDTLNKHIQANWQSLFSDNINSSMVWG